MLVGMSIQDAECASVQAQDEMLRAFRRSFGMRRARSAELPKHSCVADYAVAPAFTPT
jgi:hypothetical protein